MGNYLVLACRHDVPSYAAGWIHASSDEEAKDRFKREYVENKNYAWDHLDLLRVVNVDHRDA